MVRTDLLTDLLLPTVTMGNKVAKQPKDTREAEDVFTGFFRTPTQENYEKLLQHDAVFRQKIGINYELFLCAIAEKWQLGSFPPHVMANYRQIVSRLLDEKTVLHAGQLDMLWALFHATGEKRYADRIKLVAEGTTLADPLAQMAAVWSHQSHIKQGLLSE